MMKRSDNELNLEHHFSHRKEWTDTDDNLLLTYSATLKDTEIADLMGRTVPSIWSRRKRLRREGYQL